MGFRLVCTVLHEEPLGTLYSVTLDFLSQIILNDMINLNHLRIIVRNRVKIALWRVVPYNTSIPLILTHWTWSQVYEIYVIIAF